MPFPPHPFLVRYLKILTCGFTSLVSLTDGAGILLPAPSSRRPSFALRPREALSRLVCSPREGAPASSPTLAQEALRGGWACQIAAKGDHLLKRAPAARNPTPEKLPPVISRCRAEARRPVWPGARAEEVPEEECRKKCQPLRQGSNTGDSLDVETSRSIFDALS